MTPQQAQRTYGAPGHYAEYICRENVFGRAVRRLGPVRCYFMAGRWHLDQKPTTTPNIIAAANQLMSAT